MKKFRDKVAVVTGAASGIGRGLAERCAKEGMKVVLADVEERALNKVEKDLKEKGADVLAIKTDVSKYEDIKTLAQKTLDAFGGVHLLFNNAGVQVEGTLKKPTWENSLADWEWLLGVNLWGVIHGVKVFTPIMLRQDTECHIVNTSSMAGLITESQLVIYAVTKAGVIKLSEGLYLQLQQTGSQIGVSVLCPFLVDSELGTADRNRPAELKNLPDTQRFPELPSLFSEVQEVGLKSLSPAECAEIAFWGIRDGQFYILTDRIIDKLIKQRIDNIYQRLNPEMPKL